MIFVVLGLLFIFTPGHYFSAIFRNSSIIRIVGVVAVLFFGAALFFIIRKMFDNAPGLIIDEYGITDNSNASRVGLIEWNDIVDIKTKQVMSTKFLLIFTSNPDKYLERANVFQRKLMKGNQQLYGTPLSISSSTLKYNFDDLEKLVKSRFFENQK
jgi:hypothetical protein